MSKQKRLITISINHSIFLNRDQRYSLHEGNDIETIGVSMPIWFYKGSTTEPGEEVFCKYLLTNKGKSEHIRFNEGGYAINLPQLPETFVRQELDLELWRKLTEEQKNNWYESNKSPKSSENLLDIGDGGAAYLAFKMAQTMVTHYGIREEFLDRSLNTVHFVTIRDEEKFLPSIMHNL
jgi:hypothetical protein